MFTSVINFSYDQKVTECTREVVEHIYCNFTAEVEVRSMCVYCCTVGVFLL